MSCCLFRLGLLQGPQSCRHRFHFFFFRSNSARAKNGVISIYKYTQNIKNRTIFHLESISFKLIKKKEAKSSFNFGSNLLKHTRLTLQLNKSARV